MRGLSLCSGVGMLDLAAEWAGIEIVGQVENDPFCLEVLADQRPHVKRMENIKDVQGNEFGPVEIVFGGIPCQPFSGAGLQLGTDDDRYLWREAFRIITVSNPTWVVIENVANNLTWKVRVTKSKRLVFQLAPSMRHTSDNERASWPTPIANNAIGGRGFKDDGTPYPNRIAGVTLIDAVKGKAWSTPTAREAMPEGFQSGMNRHTPSLTTTAKAWLTPCTSDTNGIRKLDGKRSGGLNTQVVWSTPMTHDAQNASLPPAAECREDLPGDMLRNGLHGYLNPDWVFCLMGLPPTFATLPNGRHFKARPKRHGSRGARSVSASRTTQGD